MQRATDGRGRSVRNRFLVPLLALTFAVTALIISGARHTHVNAGRRNEAAAGTARTQERSALSPTKSATKALEWGINVSNDAVAGSSGWPHGPPGVPRLLHQVWLVRSAASPPPPKRAPPPPPLLLGVGTAPTTLRPRLPRAPTSRTSAAGAPSLGPPSAPGTGGPASCGATRTSSRCPCATRGCSSTSPSARGARLRPACARRALPAAWERSGSTLGGNAPLSPHLRVASAQ